MKVLHVIHSVDVRSGGPSHVIRKLVREQVRLGHQVSLLATSVQSAQPWEARESFTQRMQSDLAFEGVEVYLGAAFGRRQLWSKYAFSPDCARWLRRRLADPDQSPNVIHIHGVFSHLTSTAAACARRYSIPYVLRIAGTLDSKCLRMGHSRLKSVFTRLFLRKDLQRAACIHATSHSEAEELRHWVSKDSIRVIPHGVDVPDFDYSEARNEFLNRFPQLRGKRVILFLSRVVAKKRPELIVQALDELRPRHDDVALLIAGYETGHMAVLKASVQRHNLQQSVVYAGFLQGKQKRGAFAAASMFILPSLDENFGIAVLEAMAHAFPLL